MSDDPRSYRVPVLRLSDFSKAAGLSNTGARDDDFEFNAPPDRVEHTEEKHQDQTFLSDDGNGVSDRTSQRPLEPAVQRTRTDTSSSQTIAPTATYPSTAAVPQAPQVSSPLPRPPLSPAPSTSPSTSVPAQIFTPTSTPSPAVMSIVDTVMDEIPVFPTPPISVSAAPEPPPYMSSKPPQQYTVEEKESLRDPLDMWERADVQQPPILHIQKSTQASVAAPYPDEEIPIGAAHSVQIPSRENTQRVPTARESVHIPEPLRAPLQKQPDPFVQFKTKDLPDMWELAEERPRHSVAHKKPTLASDVMRADAVRSEEVPASPIEDQLSEVGTRTLLTEALNGMGFGEFANRPITLALNTTTTDAVPETKEIPIIEPNRNASTWFVPATQVEVQDTTPKHTDESNLSALRDKALRRMSGTIQGVTSHTEVLEHRVPETQHARALAEVATALHEIRGDGDALAAPDSAQAAPPQQTQGATSFEGTQVNTEIRHVEVSTTSLSTPPPPQPLPEHAHPTLATPTRLSGVPMLRTFKSDMERTINKDRVSVVKMIADQETHRHAADDVTVRTTTRRHFTVGTSILISVTILLLVASIGFGVFLYSMATRSAPIDTSRALFFADKSIEYDVTGQDRLTILQGITRVRESVALPSGHMMEIILNERHVVGDSVQTTTVTGKNFLTRMNSRAPDSLMRTVQDSFVVGGHQRQDRNSPFIVIRVGDQANAFSSMLVWEETIDTDLAPFIGEPVPRIAPPQEQPAAMASTTASTTQPVSTTTEILPTQVQTAPLTFVDESFANIQVRVLRDFEDTVRLLWAMPDAHTIVITTNPETLNEIRDRMIRS